MEELDDWELKEGKIVKNFLFESFIEGIEFVNDVAAIAEAQNHHPVITINFKNVKVSSLSFDVGRLTDRDFKLAKAIDNLHKKIDDRVPSVNELQPRSPLPDWAVPCSTSKPSPPPTRERWTTSAAHPSATARSTWPSARRRAGGAGPAPGCRTTTGDCGSRWS